MTVAELIEKLKAFPPDAEVRVLDTDTDFSIPATDVGVTTTGYAIRNGERVTTTDDAYRPQDVASFRAEIAAGEMTNPRPLIF